MFPDMSGAFWGWSETIQFEIVRTTPVDFEAVETKSDPIRFEGVLQPMPERKLMIKPEGERTWKWWTLWTTQCLTLDQVIVDQEKLQYRVMKVSDWRGGRYQEFELTQQPNNL